MIRVLVSFLAAGSLVAGVFVANSREDRHAWSLDWRLINERPHEVLVERPSLGRIVQTITAPGKIEPLEKAKIASQVLGRVVEVYVKEGDAVKTDDMLVRIDDHDARARLDSASAGISKRKAAITRADEDLKKAERDMLKFATLSLRGAATPTELADARTTHANAIAALEMSKKELAESEAMLRTNEQEVDRYKIRAPISGVVSGLDVSVGEVVIAGTTNLPGTVMMSISDQSRMQVRSNVDETDVQLVKAGQRAQVFLRSDPLNPIPGTVLQLAPMGTSPALDGEIVNFETKVKVDNSGTTLRDGMTATVEIEVRREEKILSVPVRAVVHRRRKDLPDTPAIRAWLAKHASTSSEKGRETELRYVQLVFVAEKGIARARPVETGISDEQRVGILSGLEANDSVIVGPFRTLDELKDGQSIQVTGSITDEKERRE